MAESRRILLSEDNDDIRKMLAIRLEVVGYTVLQARDGEEALDTAKKEKPDLIILDLMMPKLSGFEVCRMLKFDDAYKNIPIIVLSALQHQRDREKAVEAGADAYFIKPFDLELLLNKIKTLIDEIQS
jgi:DNA-binding response OmpR family regulator